VKPAFSKKVDYGPKSQDSKLAHGPSKNEQKHYTEKLRRMREEKPERREKFTKK